MCNYNQAAAGFSLVLIYLSEYMTQYTVCHLSLSEQAHNTEASCSLSTMNYCWTKLTYCDII